MERHKKICRTTLLFEFDVEINQLSCLIYEQTYPESRTKIENVFFETYQKLKQLKLNRITMQIPHKTNERKRCKIKLLSKFYRTLDYSLQIDDPNKRDSKRKTGDLQNIINRKRAYCQLSRTRASRHIRSFT